MRYWGLCAFLGVAFLSCTPDIGNSPPPDVVTARFDPSIADVPTPTDLVRNPTTGKLQIPDGGNLSPAELEFVGYLNTLDGYPPDTPATANFDAQVDPNSVTRASVPVLDITDPRAPATVDVTPHYSDVGSPPKGQITIQPSTGWTIGHQYMIALIAGTNGLKGLGGRPVVGSAAWALISSANPLVTCPNNLSDPNCRPTTDVIPSKETDPAKRIADQTATGKLLEMLRQAYAPLFGALTARGINRNDIVLLWTFSILSRPQMTFDPATQVIPFPNNLAAAPLPDGGLRINLPIPDGGSPLELQLRMGLNTLDGFSTSAPIVSENSDPLAALTADRLNPDSLDAGTGVLNLSPTGIQPKILPCLDCVSSLLPDGGVPNNPEQLQLVPVVPLQERSNYIAYFTDNLKTLDGGTIAATAAWALLRNRNPLVDSSGNSTVSTVPTPLAQQLEPARLSMKQALDGLEQIKGITREHLLLASSFRTQSEETTLRQLRGVASAVPATPQNFPVFTSDHAFYRGEIVLANILTGDGGVFNPAVVRPETVLFQLSFPTTPEPDGGWPLTIFGHGLTRTRADAFLLADNFTDGGQAVIAVDNVWHGDRATCIGSAPFLATDANPCGPQPPTPSPDDAACANPVTQLCCEDSTCPLWPGSAGRCVPRSLQQTPRPAVCTPNPDGGMPGDILCMSRNPSQGHCVPNPDPTSSCGSPASPQAYCCEGAYFKVHNPFTDPTPCVSGQNLLNLTNLFATRDNFRQQVIDLTQLARVIVDAESGSLRDQLARDPVSPHAIDPNRINYVGQSLGSIVGALYLPVAPEIHNVVLNVPGSDLATILLTSPTFEPAKVQFLATLAAQNPPIIPGTPAFDDFVGIAKWILDPADPINAGYGVLHGPGLPGTRRALIQYITDDQVIPNPTTLELIGAANQTVSTATPIDVCLYDPPVCTADHSQCHVCTAPGDPTCGIPLLPTTDRHGFLLDLAPNFGDQVTTIAQRQAVSYLNNPTAPSCPIP